MSEPRHDAMWSLYLDKIREDAHQLLAWAYMDVRSSLNGDTTEPVMTSLLADAMRARLDYHPDTPASFESYSIHPEDPVSPRGETGREQLRLDIAIQLNGVRPRGVFVFEAKRLRTNGFPIGLYSGAGGVRCFIDDRYAQHCREAAMIACWQNGSLPYWLKELRRTIDEDRALVEPLMRVLEGLRQAAVVPDLPDEWETTHKRVSGNRLRLFHIFLDCR